MRLTDIMRCQNKIKIRYSVEIFGCQEEVAHVFMQADDMSQFKLLNDELAPDMALFSKSIDLRGHSRKAHEPRIKYLSSDYRLSHQIINTWLMLYRSTLIKGRSTWGLIFPGPTQATEYPVLPKQRPKVTSGVSQRHWCTSWVGLGVCPSQYTSVYLSDRNGYLPKKLWPIMYNNTRYVLSI